MFKNGEEFLRYIAELGIDWHMVEVHHHVEMDTPRYYRGGIPQYIHTNAVHHLEIRFVGVPQNVIDKVMEATNELPEGYIDGEVVEPELTS